MRSVHAAGLACALGSLLLYSNSLNCNFCFDDLSAVQENSDLRPDTPWSNLLWNDFWGTPMHIEGSHKSYRPLSVATFRLNYLWHGLSPMGYHVVNVVLHAVVCYLYVQLCALIFNSVWPALLAGLLFAAHPIHTEAVAGVVGRAELLSSLFFLLVLLCYHHASCPTHQHTSKGWAWLFGSLVLCLLSVLCKEQGITVLAVCLVRDIFIVHKNTLQSLLTKTKTVPRLLVVRVGVVVTFLMAILYLRLQLMQTTLPVFTVHDNPAVGLPTPYRQLHWLYLVFVNAWLLLCPAFLCADWTMGTIPPLSSLTDPRHLATVACLLGLAGLGLYSVTSSSRRAKTVLFALSLIVFPFLPASNLFFPVGFVVAERVLYLPSMGFCLLVGYGVWLLGHRCRGLAVLCLLFLLTGHALKTVLRNSDWTNDRSLFKAAVRINPGNGKLYNNLGHDYEKDENFTFAEKLFRRASVVQADDVGAFINLGRMLKQLKRLQEAEEAYTQAIDLMPSGKSFRVAPSHINVYYNLANLIKGDPARLHQAHALYQQAIAMRPDFVEAHMNRGDLLLQMNQTEEAKEAFSTALRYNPAYIDAHFNLGTALFQLGRRKEAEDSYKKALSLDPTHSHALLGLAVLLQEESRKKEALRLYEQVLAVDPGNVRAYANLALLHLDLEAYDKAEEMFLRALAVDHTYRSALYNLGVLYHHQQRLREATSYLQQLVQHHPQHLNGAQLLGDCYFKSNQLDQAEHLYRHVLNYSPTHVAALHNLGVVMAERLKYDEAIALFQKVLALDPTHSAAHKHLQQAVKQQQLQHNNGNGTVQEGATQQRPHNDSHSQQQANQQQPSKQRRQPAQ